MLTQLPVNPIECTTQYVKDNDGVWQLQGAYPLKNLPVMGEREHKCILNDLSVLYTKECTLADKLNQNSSIEVCAADSFCVFYGDFAHCELKRSMFRKCKVWHKGYNNDGSCFNLSTYEWSDINIEMNKHTGAKFKGNLQLNINKIVNVIIKKEEL